MLSTSCTALSVTYHVHCINIRQLEDACWGYAQKEAKRFLGALAKRCHLAGSNVITTAQLYSLADDLDLAVPDTEAFIGELNEAGEMQLVRRGITRTEDHAWIKCFLLSHWKTALITFNTHRYDDCKLV